VPVAHACNPRYSEGRDQEDRGKIAQAKKFMRPYLKNIQHKMASGVTQVVEPLPSKYEAPSSNPSTGKNKNKKTKKCVKQLFEWKR
jgi:hypothetical protein